MKELDAIKQALAAGPTPAGTLPWPLISACNPAAMQAVLAHIEAQADELDRLRADAKRIDALEKLHSSQLRTDIWIGGNGRSASIYQRTGIGSNLAAHSDGSTVREAVDAISAAMKEQP